ncbi:MAG TPA: DUF1127 domain-containing protein [Stellaceae bacterium]|nr:DUF1127 domain-containing protein [Stellaceae bacterium]
MDSSEDDSSSLLDAPAAGLAPRLAGLSLAARLRRAVARWQARIRSRRLLARLDQRMLRDIGIDRARVWQETGKWFWQP